MTSALAAIGLTYDGEDLQRADLGLFLQITQGLNETAEVRGRDTLVPALDGMVVRNRRKTRLRIVLTGQIMGVGAGQEASRSDYRTTQKFVRDLFAPDRLPADLVASLEDGTTATIAARPLNAMSNEMVVSEFAMVSIELESVAPDWTIDGS